MVAYFVLDSFLLVGKQWFNPFNAFLYTALVILMYWHSQRKITVHFNPYILLLLIFFSWLGFPHFAEVNLWMAGACGYLFSAVLILTFLLPYHFSFLGKGFLKDNFFAAVGMFCGGVVAGWTIENTATSMTFVVACFTLYFFKQKRLEKWMLAGTCGSIAGLGLLIAAPGNYVRYADAESKLIYHFTNLIAAGIETFFYVLPVILFLILVWRILLTDQAKLQGILSVAGKKNSLPFAIASIWTIGAILFLLLSYLNGNFFSKWLGNLMYETIAVPLGIATPKLKLQFFNTMSGLEEMAIYLLAITQLFRYISYKLALRKKDIQGFSPAVSWRRVLTAYPDSYYAAAWIALALFNHFVMVASPNYPGRAAFGSVAFLIIGAVSTFTVPEVYHQLLKNSRKKYLVLFTGIIMIPMMAAALHQYYIIFQEDSQRIAYIQHMASEGATQVEVAPIPIKSRVLRHVYFEDLNNSLSRDFLRNYYGLKDIKLKASE
jgi:hypothetical protein